MYTFCTYSHVIGRMTILKMACAHNTGDENPLEVANLKYNTLWTSVKEFAEAHKTVQSIKCLPKKHQDQRSDTPNLPNVQG